MTPKPEPKEKRARSARALLRRCHRAALASSLNGAPYASLVLLACDLDATPLLLLSDLAQHSRNIKADRRIALLIDGTAGHADPLAGPRLTVLGEAEATGDLRLRERFCARYPASRQYADFPDFHLYRVTVARGHLVAGFGRIEWIGAEDLLNRAGSSILAAAENDMIREINERQLALLAGCTLRQGLGDGWRASGVDAEGIDLLRGTEFARLDFTCPACDPEAVRAAFFALADS